MYVCMTSKCLFLCSSDDEHFFIPGESKIHKVAPDGWKESWKVQSAPVTFTVYLRVKFYPENIAEFKWVDVP